MARTPPQIEADRTKMAQMHLEGMTTLEIANQMELTQSTVNRDLKAIKKQWREAAEGERLELLSLEIAKLSYLERVAWEAWNASKEPRKTQTSTMRQAEKLANKVLEESGKTGGRVQSVLKSETREGNPVLLKLIFDCIRQRCSLYGLAPRDSVDAVVDEKLTEKFSELMELLRQHLPQEVHEPFFEAATTAAEELAKVSAR